MTLSVKRTQKKQRNTQVTGTEPCRTAAVKCYHRSSRPAMQRTRAQQCFQRPPPTHLRFQSIHDLPLTPHVDTKHPQSGHRRSLPLATPPCPRQLNFTARSPSDHPNTPVISDACFDVGGAAVGDILRTDAAGVRQIRAWARRRNVHRSPGHAAVNDEALLPTFALPEKIVVPTSHVTSQMLPN